MESRGRRQDRDAEVPIFESQYVDIPWRLPNASTIWWLGRKGHGRDDPDPDRLPTRCVEPDRGVVGAHTVELSPDAGGMEDRPALACGNTVISKPASHTSPSSC